MDVREKAANEKRLIDANELKKKMCFKCNDEYSDEPCDPDDCVFCNAINDAQTIDAVSVVRCWKCKNWHEETGFCELHSYFVDSDGVCCSPADSPNWTMFDPDDFCSYGKRKEGAD